MAAHKYWQALCVRSAAADALELSEFQLFSGASRVDAAATLTASAAPSGAIANLQDDSTATGCYWATGADALVLTWEFPAPQEITGIALGARTTAARWPTGLYMRGGDAATGTGPSPEYTESMAFSVPPFVSASKTVVLPAGAMVREYHGVYRSPNFSVGGAGYVPYIVETEISPATSPKTYTPQWARVQLARFMDGRVMQEQWSNPVTGEGVFHAVDENFLYTVTAIYPDGNKRAVVADRLQPLVYPALVWP